MIVSLTLDAGAEEEVLAASNLERRSYSQELGYIYPHDTVQVPLILRNGRVE
jgi:hypothetical protein